jgi:heme/copper-type cytochrome/quinol oxidase subunit 2
VPPAGRRSSLSGMQIAAVIIIVIIAVSAIYYFAVYSKPKNYLSENILIEIGGPIYNATDPSASIPAAYYPSNFTVAQGDHITFVVHNEDNVTHGFAVREYNVDTGVIQANQTKMVSIVTNLVGNFTYYEPSADCGGGNCDANADLVGWFVVNATGRS